ncbi:MAG: type IX secretion system membrane protein PorP/SprF [Bacteroidota bacterium]
MKTIIIVLSGLLFTGILSAQQDIQFSQALSNPYLFNPAAGGMANVAEFNIGTRAQWLSVEGKPMTYYASGQSQIRSGKTKKTVLDEFNLEHKSIYNSPERTIGLKHVIGGKVVSDVIGPFARTGFMGSYAIHMPFTKKINVGLGIGLGMNSFSINESKVTLMDANDGAYLSYVGASNRQSMVDVQSGLVFYNNKFYFGLSGSQLLKNKAQFKGIETESRFERHWYAVASYRFDIMEKKFGIEPVAIVKKTVASPLSYDVGARFHYYNMGWISLGYRGNAALSAGFGFNVLRQFRLAYAFEMGVSNLRSYGNGSHEIQLGFVFGRKRNMEKEFKQQEKEHQQQLDDELKIGTN